VLELSLREALQLSHNYLGTEHILLGLIREGEGVAAQVVVQHHAPPGQDAAAVVRVSWEQPRSACRRRTRSRSESWGRGLRTLSPLALVCDDDGETLTGRALLFY
jgi:hypothetical protein